VYCALPSVTNAAPETVSREPPVAGPEIGDSESQFSKAKRNVEEVPDLNGMVCPPKTCTISRDTERTVLVHFGEEHTIDVLEAGTTGAESTEEAPKAENLHWTATDEMKPAPETVIKEPPATGAV